MVILLVDDDTAVLAVMARALQRMHRVMVADSLQAARGLLVSGNPAAALALPAGCGYLEKPFTVSQLRAAVEATAADARAAAVALRL